MLAALSFFPYEISGNRGVGVGIDNIMKIKDGESLCGRPGTESDFAGVQFDDDEEDI